VRVSIRQLEGNNKKIHVVPGQKKTKQFFGTAKQWHCSMDIETQPLPLQKNIPNKQTDLAFECNFSCRKSPL